MAPRNSTYCVKWEQNRPWLSSCPTSTLKAYCNVCDSEFNVANMGVGAVDSHAKGARHIQKEHEQAGKKGGGQSRLVLGGAGKVTAAATDSMYVPPELHPLRAEVIETLHKVEHNISFNCAQNDGDRFRLMFPGHKAAEKYACSYTKSAYLVTHGISPYVKQKLKEDCANTPYTIKFDETTTSQTKKQFDMYISYWSGKYNQVINLYVGSKFVGHCTANDLVIHCKELMEEMGLTKPFLLHIGMDGPKVNLKFQKEIELAVSSDEDDPSGILDIGTCTLHPVSNAYKYSLKKLSFQFECFFNDVNFFFKLSAARREDYKHVSESIVGIAAQF